jgi:hypothetical protein
MALFVRRRWPKVAAAVAVLLVLVLVVLLVRGGSDDGSGSSARGGDPAVEETEVPVPDPTLDAGSFPALLTAPDSELKTYVDQQVTADGVPVQAVAGPSAVWVGESAADRVLVVTTGDEAFRVSPGTRLAFTGVVRPGEAEFASSLGVKGGDLAEFRKQAVYVEVERYDTR